MALKDLSSLYDLVGGNQPVGNMSNQQGAQSFDLGPDSMLQQNSLPGPTGNSEYQDLDAIDGGNGYFHGVVNPQKYQGKKIGKKDLHEHLLTKKYSYTYGNSPENVGPAPGPTGNSEFQDLDAVDGGNGYFHGIVNPGKYQGKQLGGVDLHEALLQNTPYNYTYGTSTQFYNPVGQAGPYQTEPFPLDLNGGLPSTGKYEDNMPQ